MLQSWGMCLQEVWPRWAHGCEVSRETCPEAEDDLLFQEESKVQVKAFAGICFHRAWVD
jgi:hypothetical protein